MEERKTNMFRKIEKSDGLGDQAINREIVELVNKGKENYDNFNLLVQNDLSYCMAGMKLLCDEYKNVYARSSETEQSELEGVDLIEINKQYNIISCWFQLNENFNLIEMPKEKIIEDSSHLSCEDYNAICDNIYEIYNKTVAHLRICIENNYQINEELQTYFDQISEYDEKGEFSFTLDGLEEKDCENIINYLEKWNDIAYANEDYIEAEKEVLQMYREDEEEEQCLE